MLLPVILEKPTTLAVSLEDTKKHLDVFGFNDDDNQITDIIQAATQNLEKTLNLTLNKTKFFQYFKTFENVLRLSIFPIINIEKITYRNENNEEQTLDKNSYQLIETINGSYVCVKGHRPKTNNEIDAIKIFFYGGYEGDDIPPSLKAAMLLHIGSLYEHREDLSNTKPISTDAYNALIWPYRRPKV
ncbi:head-tail connector protein [Bartonella tamiae]|uniref:Phage gp6-like head-tail connector protein n=1 Tax=Bartonella tamiae Th239 TaxID=1094558 RepID=J1K2G5_9HYPH|nr:phage head-tail connector protein [Bartonella tamiae]EJF91677.1 hypothetical protein ME5_00056 [Bartonella tamiae Th239]